MGVLEKYVDINLSSGDNYRYYKNLGYDIVRPESGFKRNDTFTIKIEDLRDSSSVKVTKVCDVCGVKIPNITYSTITESRKNTDGVDRCFKCSQIYARHMKMMKLEYEKSLEFHAKSNNLEYLLEEFDEENEYSPLHISYASNKEYNWNCSKCKSKYKMQVVKRTTRNFNCPYCKGRRVNETNSVESKLPELIKEWNYERNNKKPSEVYCLSTKKYWWKCISCNSEYERSIRNAVEGIGCPYCASQKINDTNSLEVLFQDIASEFHKTKNGDLTSKNIAKASTKRVWWQCSKCEFEWVSTVAHRTCGNTGCPMCKSSKGERKIYNYLKSNNIDFEFQKCFDDLIGLGGKQLSYDFYLLEKNILIEYQGLQHSSYSEHFHKNKDGYEKQLAHDEMKKSYASSKEIDVIEILHTQYENIEKILDLFLK